MTRGRKGAVGKTYTYKGIAITLKEGNLWHFTLNNVETTKPTLKASKDAIDAYTAQPQPAPQQVA